MNTLTGLNLPGLDCGQCGARSCSEFAERLSDKPGMLKRCIHLSASSAGVAVDSPAMRARKSQRPNAVTVDATAWTDSLGREFDFFLEHFPEDPGPREIILPHNHMLTRELKIKRGDVLIGRPLGISCGCPITHCGVVMEADHLSGVIVWCVTGPLTPRQKGYTDLGFYIAEGYEGLVRKTRVDLRIGMRYFFQPRMCMLQWRHSGLVNYMNRTESGHQVRLEGLWIG